MLVFAASLYAQNGEVRKIDEFGSDNCEMFAARADLMVQTQADNPNAKIYVFVYEGKETIPVYKKSELVEWKKILPQFGLAKARIQAMKNYLKFRKVRLENYVFANGGFREDFRVEIWLVPPGAQPPKPAPTLGKMKYRKGKPGSYIIGCGV